MWTHAHGRAALGQGQSSVLMGDFAASAQRLQLRTRFSMSESIFGQYAWLRAIAFMRETPGCPSCSCRSTRRWSVDGITTRSPYMRQSSAKERELFRSKNFLISGLQHCRGQLLLRDLITRCRIQSLAVSSAVNRAVTVVPRPLLEASAATMISWRGS
ncbi:hypothetical protein M514_05773 [Trichuris suis]|uniref:Uncharacterized protein n=1 Tax=Trichuris suis TaxID=68888 RepID=A0A085NA81_9BILA|nr:hypothetical protein M514_05773 [Trichuris suis]